MDAPPEPSSDAGSSRRPLDPRVRTLWQVVALLATAPLVLVLLGGGLIVLVTGDPGPGAGLVAGAVVVVGLAVGVPVIRHRRWSWALTDEGLELAHGVLVRTESAIPTFRVQQVDVRQGPIERAFGLVTLTITTASAGSDGTLPGIDADGADEVRRRILHRVAVDDGV
ncbi:MAG TPA: PH domain-containing protein [Iamia sp.]|nr:PH domain-containing protein [Iamia sp.]